MRMRLAGICQMSLGQFRQRVEEPTCCYRLILHPARRTDTQAPAGRQTESIWLEFTPALAGTMVNCLLGDNSTEALSSRRSVTPVERRLLRQIVQQLADALAATWTAPPPRAASVAEDYGLTGADGDCGLEQSLAVLSFSVSLPGQVGTIRLAMSETLLESMLNRQVPAGGPKKSLEVSASLAEMLVPSDELTALAPGDILMTDAPAEGQAVVRLAGIAKFAGSLGCWGGRRAVSVKGRFSAGQARCNAPAESSSTVPPNRHRR
jgi:flagellar motor switch protein FliM